MMAARTQLMLVLLTLPSAYSAIVGMTADELAVREARWQEMKDYAATENKVYSTTCNRDMRDRMPACHQFGGMWCWATGISELYLYYNTDKNASYPECVGLECSIVSYCPVPDCSVSCGLEAPCDFTKKMECCPYTDDNVCRDYGATFKMMTQTVKHFTGIHHKFTGAPLSQKKLDSLLSAGYPILLIIGPRGSSGAHVTALSGCGGGKYYLHDPELQAGVWQEVDYATLLDPYPQISYGWIWIDTMIPKIDDELVV